MAVVARPLSRFYLSSPEPVLNVYMYMYMQFLAYTGTVQRLNNEIQATSSKKDSLRAQILAITKIPALEKTLVSVCGLVVLNSLWQAFIMFVEICAAQPFNDASIKSQRLHEAVPAVAICVATTLAPRATMAPDLRATVRLSNWFIQPFNITSPCNCLPICDSAGSRLQPHEARIERALSLSV